MKNEITKSNQHNNDVIENFNNINLIDFDDIMNENKKEHDDIINPNIVNLWIIKRSTRKTQTLISGLDQNLDLKKLVSAWKNLFNCSGSIKTDDNNNKYIKLSGDQREKIKNFLIEEEIVKKQNIKIRGF